MKKIKTKLLSALIILSITIPQTVTFADGATPANSADDVPGVVKLPKFKQGEITLDDDFDLGISLGRYLDTTSGATGTRIGGNFKLKKYLIGATSSNDSVFYRDSNGHLNSDGFYLNPGINIQADFADKKYNPSTDLSNAGPDNIIDNRKVHRLSIDATALALYRFQNIKWGSENSSGDEKLATVIIPQKEKAYNEKYKSNEILLQQYEEALFNYNHAKHLRKICVSYCNSENHSVNTTENRVDEIKRKINSTLGNNFVETLEKEKAEIENLRKKLMISKSAPFATGEIILGQIGYNYQEDQDFDLRLSMGTFDFLSLAGHAAVKLNGINMDFCGLVKPIGIAIANSSAGKKTDEVNFDNVTDTLWRIQAEACGGVKLS